MYAMIDWHVLDEKTPMRYVDKADDFSETGEWFINMMKEYKEGKEQSEEGKPADKNFLVIRPKKQVI